MWSTFTTLVGIRTVVNKNDLTLWGHFVGPLNSQVLFLIVLRGARVRVKVSVGIKR